MHETDKTKLTDQTKFRLYEIKKIDNYFINEINQQKSYSKKLNRYVTIFDYIDKILIVLSATTGGISIISFTTAIGAPVGIASASFTLIFSLTTGIIKKLLDITRKKKRRHDKILMLAESKFNSIEALMSQAWKARNYKIKQNIKKNYFFSIYTKDVWGNKINAI